MGTIISTDELFGGAPAPSSSPSASPPAAGGVPPRAQVLSTDELFGAGTFPRQGDGVTRNTLAGAYGAVANTLGFLPDVADAANRLVVAPLSDAFSDYVVRPGSRALGSVLGFEGLPDLTEEEKAARSANRPESIGSSAQIRRGLASVGAPVQENTEAVTTSEKMARGFGAAATDAVTGRAAAGAAKDATTGLARAALEAIGSGGFRANALLGGASGAGAAAAGEATDNPALKPLAEVGGGLAAGAGAALAGAGANAAGRGVASLWRGVTAPFTQAGRERMVAETLRRNASDPAGLAARLDTPNAEVVPGSAPTTAQLANDPGLVSMETSVAARNPAAFMQRANEQNAARTAALEGIAPDGRPAAVGDFLRKELSRIDDEFASRIQAATAARDDAVQVMGGTGERVSYGERIRAELEAVKADEKKRLGRLYAAVDPDGALVLDASSIKAKAREIVSTLPKAASLSPTEARLLDVVGSMSAAERFSEIMALRSELTTAARAERAAGGDTQAARRLTILRGAIDDAISGMDGETKLSAAADGASGSNPAISNPVPRVGSAVQTDTAAGAPAAGTRVFTPAGRGVDVRYEVIEGDTLRPASGDLQPRDRSRAASDAQIAEMASRLQPERLGASAEAGTGAPIVGPDGIVESGNGRYRAIMQAHSRGGPVGQAYRDYLTQQGYDVSGFKNPVLVRRRTSDLSPEERVAFVREANASSGLQYGAAERAALDAQHLDDSVLQLYRGGALDDAGNRDLVRAFAGKLDRGDVGSFATRDGTLSADGLRRLRTAMTARAYDDAALVEGLAETGDDAIKAFGAALTDAAPAVAALRSGIEAGRVQADLDISSALRDAVRLVRDARGRAVPLGDAVRQLDAFNQPDPLALRILQAAYGPDLGGRINRGRLVETLRTYADEAGKAQAGPSLFGDATAVNKGDIWGVAERRAFTPPPADGTGPFGPIWNAFRGDAKGAVDVLLRARNGEAPGALHHPAIGEIDLVWGRTSDSRKDTGFGLAKIERWHPEVLDDLQGPLLRMEVASSSPNRTVLVSDTHRAVVSHDFQGQAKNWLLTEFEKRGGGGPGATAAGIGAEGATLPGATQSRPGQGAGPSYNVARGRAGGNADVTEPELTPNFGPDDAARYRGANDEYRVFAERFKGRPLGGRGGVLTSGKDGMFVVPNSEVAGRFFNAGKRQTEDVNAFVAAVGGREAAVAELVDYAASSMRTAAVKPDGSFDRKAWGNWLLKHTESLKVLDTLSGGPEMRQRFAKAADAQKLVDNITAERAGALEGFRSGSAKPWLEGDPVNAVAAAFRTKSPAGALLGLRGRVGRDPEALAGLRRAVVEFIQRDLTGNTMAGDTGTLALKSDAFQTWVKRNRGALKTVFPERHIDTMEAVAADLQRAQLSRARAGSGSDTAQKLAAMGKLPGGVSVLQRIVSAAGGAGGGAAIGGPVGAIAGTIAAEAYAAGRALGMERVNTLLTEVMLDPGLARRLLAQHPDATRAPGAMKAVREALVKAGVVAVGEVVRGDEER